MAEWVKQKFAERREIAAAIPSIWKRLSTEIGNCVASYNSLHIPKGMASRSRGTGPAAFKPEINKIHVETNVFHDRFEPRRQWVDVLLEGLAIRVVEDGKQKARFTFGLRSGKRPSLVVDGRAITTHAAARLVLDSFFFPED